MKDKIHPSYNAAITVTCACGNSFEVGSTAKEISVEVCSACHPFYTGKQKLVDTAGRVDKFRQRQEEAVKLREEKKTKKSSANKSSKKSKKEVTKIG